MNISPDERRKGIIGLFILVLIWGVLPVVPRFLSNDFKLFQQVYLRLAVGFIFSLILFSGKINLTKIFSLPAKDLFWIIFRASAYFLLGVVLNTQALLLTKISNVTLIGTVPVTALLGFILLKEKPTLGKIILIVISFIGALIISVTNFSSFTLGMGEFVAFLSSLSISFALVSRKWQSKYLNDQETSTLVIFFAAVEIFIFSFFLKEGLPVNNWGIGAVGFLIAGGLLNAGVSFFSNYGLARVDAVLSGNILMLEPVLASFFGFLIFKEIPVARELFGGLIIIASVILMNYSENKVSPSSG